MQFKFVEANVDVSSWVFVPYFAVVATAIVGVPTAAIRYAL